ncbi:MAG: hypothetical protein JNM70_11020 [Anaerolineae bacterium]|nr:hypothetical protein [Anaerolineae bacterium]
MATKPLDDARYYARLICDYLKQQPGCYVDDPAEVREALGISKESFQRGLDWCLKRKIIVLEMTSPPPPAPAMTPAPEKTELAGTANKLSSMLRSPAPVFAESGA